MLRQAWAAGDLIDELAVTRQAFRYTGLAGSTPPLATRMQATASTSQQPDDLLPRQPAPMTVQYQPPSFKLTRLVTCLTRSERIQVHHNYISAVSSLEHKKNLINRLKRSASRNISAYEAEMSRHMTLHKDVLDRILNILKQDDYYRTLEDLPVIDELTAYDDIRLFPELFDTNTIIDLPHKTTPNLQPTSTNNSTESSPQSSLPCGQRTPTASTSSSNTPTSQTPPQTFVHPPHQPKIPTPTQHMSPSPHRQHIKMPLKTNVNQTSQPSIVEENQQHVPKSTNNSQVKCSKQPQQEERHCFHCNQPGHLKRNCPKNSLLFKMQNERTHTGQMHQQFTEDRTHAPSWQTQRPTEKE